MTNEEFKEWAGKQKKLIDIEERVAEREERKRVWSELFWKLLMLLMLIGIIWQQYRIAEHQITLGEYQIESQRNTHLRLKMLEEK